MKKLFYFGVFLLVVIALSGCSNSNPAVKKSNSGICHEKGNNYYEKTKNFTSYNSLSACLDSGGRIPKK